VVLLSGQRRANSRLPQAAPAAATDLSTHSSSPPRLSMICRWCSSFHSSAACRHTARRRWFEDMQRASTSHTIWRSRQHTSGLVERQSLTCKVPAQSERRAAHHSGVAQCPQLQEHCTSSRTQAGWQGAPRIKHSHFAQVCSRAPPAERFVQVQHRNEALGKTSSFFLFGHVLLCQSRDLSLGHLDDGTIAYEHQLANNTCMQAQ